jgi:hypothetical protein
MTALKQRKTALAVRIGGLVVLGALGGLVGYGLAAVTDVDPTMPWPDQLALVVAVALIAMGVVGGVMARIKPETAPQGLVGLQVAVMILAGVLFLLPVFGGAFVSPGVAFAGVVVLVVVQSIANLFVWRRADEMLRRVMGEACAYAFWALQLALFLYAAAERLGLISGLTAWGMTGVMMGVYLVASMFAASRRGIA